jgi:hypothetical protein
MYQIKFIKILETKCTAWSEDFYFEVQKKDILYKKTTF